MDVSEDVSRLPEEILFTVTDPQGRQVILTAACFTFHILIAHPKISEPEIIGETIKQPSFIARDADGERLIYYRLYQKTPRRWIKAVVEANEVVTAYRASRLKKGEQIVWQSSPSPQP